MARPHSGQPAGPGRPEPVPAGRADLARIGAPSGPDPELGVDYDTAWSRRYPVRLARAMVLDNVTRPLAQVVAAPQLRGEEGLVGLEAPVIFAANHASHVDTPLLLACLPLRFRHHTVVAAAADYFFDRRWKADTFSFLLGAIPIERHQGQPALGRPRRRAAGEELEPGHLPRGRPLPRRVGPGVPGRRRLPGARTGRPVVPVHLDGTRHILPKGRAGLRRTRTTVTFGTPLWPDEGEDARAFGARIEAAVATLADEPTTDWWTARRRAARGATPSLQGPEVAAWRRSWALRPHPAGATRTPGPGRTGPGARPRG